MSTDAAYCQACGPLHIAETYRGDPPVALHCGRCERPAEPCTLAALHAPSGHVGIGDLVIADGAWATVAAIPFHDPGQHPTGCPIVASMIALEVATLADDGREHSRWVGADDVRIRPDLRVEWSRHSGD